MNAQQAEVYNKLVSFVREYESKRFLCQTDEDRSDFDNVVKTARNDLAIAETEIANSDTGEIALARFDTLLRNVNQDSIVFNKTLFVRETYNIW